MGIDTEVGIDEVAVRDREVAGSDLRSASGWNTEFDKVEASLAQSVLVHKKTKLTLTHSVNIVHKK